MGAPKGNEFYKKAKPENIGAPSKYKDEFCQMLISHMTDGFSYESFAGKIGVAIQSLYNWEEQHQDFLEAKEKGFEKSRLFWEGIGIDIARDGIGNATAYIFNMKNRFKKQWSDSTEQNINISGKPSWMEEDGSERKS